MTDDRHIRVQAHGAEVPIQRETFTLLLGSSPARRRAAYEPALTNRSITFDKLVGLARAADIPYALFFGSHERALYQVNRKNRLILNGISKDIFAVNSRSEVELADVELIVKDLIRKQQELKTRDSTLQANTIVGCLKGSRSGVVADADRLRTLLGLSLEDLRGAKGKERALEHLITLLEARQLLVSQSQEKVMLQQLPRGRSFSGLCVKDKKIPYLFITGGEGSDRYEPAGRRILTLALLVALVARNEFKAVTFDSHTADVPPGPQWELAEELVMPRDEVSHLAVDSIEAVRAGADHFCVTPSAFTVRALRLKLIDHDTAVSILDGLRAAYAEVPKTQPRSPRMITAVRKYAGHEYTARMLHQVDRGQLSQADFCRIVALNRMRPAALPDLRATLS